MGPYPPMTQQILRSPPSEVAVTSANSRQFRASSPDGQVSLRESGLGGGEGGIRTPDTVARMPHFECGAIDHSATSPSEANEGRTGPSGRDGFLAKGLESHKAGSAGGRVPFAGPPM